MRSSIAGSLIVRTTTRWLEIPNRTRLESLFSAKRARRVSATASESTTSPSWKAPSGSAAIAVFVSWWEPPDRTSAAATLPASISRPTTDFSFLTVNSSICFLIGWIGPVL